MFSKATLRPLARLPLSIFLIAILKLFSLEHADACWQDADDLSMQALIDEELAADGLARGWLQETTDVDGKTFARTVREPNYFGLTDLDRRAKPEAISILWHGQLESFAPGEYRFAVDTNSQVTLSLKGEQILSTRPAASGWTKSQPIELSYGLHEVELRLYTEATEGRMAIYWKGPRFGWERLAPSNLLHEVEDTVANDWQRGLELSAAYRCSACHLIPNESEQLSAPNLKQLNDKLKPEWLIARLANDRQEVESDKSRRMPHFKVSNEEAIAITAYLFADESASRGSSKQNTNHQLANEAAVIRGKQLAETIGCLACHQVETFGASGIFGGGDLTTIAEKRPEDFFAKWLRDPSHFNANHRMPKFVLSDEETNDLAIWLTSLRAQEQAESQIDELPTDQETIEAGKALYQQHRCGSCHETDTQSKRVVIAHPENLAQRCGGVEATKSYPAYHFDVDDLQALEVYLKQPAKHSELSLQGKLRQLNCTACHQRGNQKGIATNLTKLLAERKELAPLASALHAPTLNGVGDKLKSNAINKVLVDGGNHHRPWLKLRMPQYEFADAHRSELVHRIVNNDRMPSGLVEPLAKIPEEQATASGARLVTSAGFGCASCHRIGSIAPPDGPIDARGPSLSMLGDRIHADWFRRWVANPARFQPGMEMPSIKTPVAGVLESDLDRQLSSVWQTLNTVGFEPPRPAPVRVVRQSGLDTEARAKVLTDVVRFRDQTLTKPLIVGLGNRHNVTFDLETARIASWWIGDTLRQHTEGKTWFWEPGGAEVLGNERRESDWTLSIGTKNQKELLPRQHVGQFATELNGWKHIDGGLQFHYELQFDLSQRTSDIQVTESWMPWQSDQLQGGSSLSSGWLREIHIVGLEEDESLTLSLQRPDRGSIRTIGSQGEQEVESFRFVVDDTQSESSVTLRYSTSLPVDQFITPFVERKPAEPRELDVVPGFRAIDLPIDVDWMPTAMSWDEQGRLYVTSLKGRVWLVTDDNQDGWEDRAEPFSDDLAAPFGVFAGEGFVDVVNKYALLRLMDHDKDGFAEEVRRLSSGWGHTTDYHDWAVGLPRDSSGAYHIAISCQQDDRSAAAAHWRGEVLKLVPTTDGSYSIEPVSYGHRFPIGIAQSEDGTLLVTDNQGNYNPFNELNEVQVGKHFGFINRIDRDKQEEVDVTVPAIKIPHPWTRSVNGICFLDGEMGGVSASENRFGPFSGHLVGCEYDTRRLVRMSLQRVDGQLQGAVYPLSWAEPPSGAPLLGPISCAVGPQGDLYVGNLRDSGWGGANNIGAMTRLQFTPEQLPLGIAEINAIQNGFEIKMTAAVDKNLALNKERYQISSFRRERTPSYGGPDLERRIESAFELQLADQEDTVRLIFEELREGFVYQFNLQPLGSSQQPFFPAEAFYSLNRIPRGDGTKENAENQQ